jgi:hypothetical protein
MIGLLYGITAWHVHILCDNPMEGGHGYSPREVGRLTLDQIIMLLSDRKLLLNRSKSMPSLAAASLADSSGTIKGVAADGTPIHGRIAGVSKARALMEKHAEVSTKLQDRPRQRRSRKGGQQ